jgi:hypothetical protein
VVVHHGGSGATLGALTVGAPQVILPQGADHFANADAARAIAEEIAGMPSPDQVAHRLPEYSARHERRTITSSTVGAQ